MTDGGDPIHSEAGRAADTPSPTNHPAPAVYPTCHGCGDDLTTGTCIRALNTTWHPTCFVCAGCDRPFDGVYSNASGRPYHQECLPPASAVTCARCGDPIDSTGAGSSSEVTHVVCAFDAHFHSDCFTCAGCSEPITGEYVADGASPYHPPCLPPTAIPATAISSPPSGADSMASQAAAAAAGAYPPGALPQCAGCWETLLPGVIASQVCGAHWHDTCLRCVVCDGAFEDAVANADGFPVHEGCAPNASSPCGGCGEVAGDGDLVCAVGRVYHPQCFKPAACSLACGETSCGM
eukprot:TRINITY_DN3273_c0_g1_i2.p1 TRINITY_DN3273_c0_g1~~TRINITY_DN3273_c0_g1_i2.p1  ORF type:complete len:293 (+),score=16.46 TRINITY_DN3273_c0_g1_i2:83-961(+)